MGAGSIEELQERLTAELAALEVGGCWLDRGRVAQGSPPLRRARQHVCNAWLLDRS